MERAPMGKSSTWQRVSKRRPCPVCKRPDWCLYTGPEDSPTAAICARTESPKRCGEGGWLHVLRDDGPTWAPWQRSIHVAIRMMHEPSNGKPDVAKLVADYRAAVRPEALGRLALTVAHARGRRRSPARPARGVGAWNNGKTYSGASDAVSVKLIPSEGR
jgi:hypothetical protein